jgi:hypothetical protein
MGNDVSLPTEGWSRSGYMNSLKTGFRRTSGCRSTRQEGGTGKISKSGADPALAERQTARIASANTRRAAKNVREIEKAEKKARDAKRAQQAERDAAISAEQGAAESANREVTLQSKRKAARDARYAARKSRSKRRQLVDDLT